MLLQVIAPHHQYSSTFPPTCHSPQFGFLLFGDDTVHCAVGGKVLEDGEGIFGLQVGVDDLLPRFHIHLQLLFDLEHFFDVGHWSKSLKRRLKRPTGPVHSPLLWYVEMPFSMSRFASPTTMRHVSAKRFTIWAQKKTPAEEGSLDPLQLVLG